MTGHVSQVSQVTALLSLGCTTAKRSWERLLGFSFCYNDDQRCRYRFWYNLLVSVPFFRPDYLDTLHPFLHTVALVSGKTIA